MRNPRGYACISDPDAGTKEADTFTCFHCNSVVFVKPMASPTDVGGMCGICAKLVCPKCVAKGNCDPFERQLDRQEASYHARRSYGF